jgi:hypothetical protein
MIQVLIAVVLMFFVQVKALAQQTRRADAELHITLNVLVVNALTGKPIPKKKVRLDLRDASESNPNLLHAGETIDDVTGPDGLVSFTFAKPQGGSLRIILAIGDWTQCSPYQYSVEQIFSSGVVAKNQCHPTVGSQIGPVPGRVVVFSQHISLSDQLKRFPG